MIDHTGKVAVVTGSARGIGLAIAKALAQGGADVAFLDINGDGAQQAAEAIAQKHGVRTWAAALDIADKTAVAAVFAQLKQDFGPVDILVNNAGLVTNVARILDMPLENWDLEISINLSGAFYCIKQVLADMVARDRGRIVSISSAAGVMGGYGQCSYSSSKAGLLGLTKTIALEHGRHHITANAVVPGLVNTDAAAMMGEKVRERIIATVPSRRMAEPHEVASVVSFLASQEASYVNGAEVHVTGGCELFTF